MMFRCFEGHPYMYTGENVSNCKSTESCGDYKISTIYFLQNGGIFVILSPLNHLLMKNKVILSVVLLLVFPLNILAQNSVIVVDVTKHHVKANGKTVCTAAINKVIDKVPEGTEIVFPAGRYVTGTIHLKSNISITLSEGAELIGSPNIDDYDSYVPTKDMSRYDTGIGTRNSNLTSDSRWTKALILGIGLKNVTITGKGTIDGGHLEDALGEEGMRGPHTILLAECANVNVSEINITRASNYAILGYELDDATFSNLHITQGWDGIHIRGGSNLHVSNCTIETGDDAIAGGYWTNMLIENSNLNSSCNALRIIEPCNGVNIDNCKIWGPGIYPHRTRLERPIPDPLPAGHDMIYGVVIEPSAWGDAPGDVSGIVIRNATIDNTWAPIAYSMGEDNSCHDLHLENIVCTHIRGVAQPINRQDCLKSWDTIELKNVVVSK